MVDFNDPFVIAQDILTVSKVWHAVGALYVWEFVTTLDYEWAVIRGTRPYRWTIWIYSFTRVSTLLAVILSLVGFNDLAPFNCEVEVLFEFLFGYLAMASASLLIVLRVIAIWNWKKVIIAIAAGAWVTNLSFLIHNIAQIRAIWVPAGIHLGCTVLNIQSTKLNIIVTLCTDIILLIVLFTALLRHRLYKRESSSLGHLLWKQGLIWLLIATVAEVPPAVFICLNLNGPLDYLFQVPAMVTMSIAATRIYRGLAEFAVRTTDIPSIADNLRTCGYMVPRANRTPAAPSALNQVIVHNAHEEYQTPQMDQRGSFIVVKGEGEVNDEHEGLRLENDLESCAGETRTLSHEA